MSREGNKQAPPPSLHGVHETSLYAEDLTAAEGFYSGALGLEKIMAVPGRHLVYRIQNSILLELATPDMWTNLQGN